MGAKALEAADMGASSSSPLTCSSCPRPQPCLWRQLPPPVAQTLGKLCPYPHPSNQMPSRQVCKCLGRTLTGGPTDLQGAPTFTQVPKQTAFKEKIPPRGSGPRNRPRSQAVCRWLSWITVRARAGRLAPRLGSTHCRWGWDTCVCVCEQTIHMDAGMGLELVHPVCSGWGGGCLFL